MLMCDHHGDHVIPTPFIHCVFAALKLAQHANSHGDIQLGKMMYNAAK